MQSSRYSSVEQAASQAKEHGWRQRAVCYVTRGPNELLVFEHDEAANASGVQLPVGGLETGETPVQAAAREAFEETGLLRLTSPHHLGSCVWSRPEAGAKQVWHYFQLTAPASTPDAWTHTVTGGEEDTGMLFYLRFVPLLQPELTPDLGSHEYLPELIQLLQESR